MNAHFMPATLRGSIAAPPSKSDAHRVLIAAALADRETQVVSPGCAQDVEATARCLRALGAGVTGGARACTVAPMIPTFSEPQLDCGESGSTLRFLLPVAAVTAPRARFIARGGLARRPLADLCACLTAHGASVTHHAPPLTLTGPITAGRYQLPGDVSSQYVSGLLFALPLLDGESEICLTSPLQSAGYVEMTLDVLRRFEIFWEATETGWRITGPQAYHSPGSVAVEGDWSGAAFFLAAGALGGPVTVTGLRADSLQRDRQLLQVLAQFGARVSVQGDAVTVSGAPLHGCRVDVSDIPDLVPILSVVAAAADGETVLENAARLRLKETDRLQTTAALLHGLGVPVHEREDALHIRGGGLRGGHVESFSDHRIAMAAAIAASICSGPVTLGEAMAVNKSYPAFYTDYVRLGGAVDGIKLW